MQAIHRLGCHYHRRAKADGTLSETNIVVDGFRNTNEVKTASFGKPIENGKAAIATYADEGIKTEITIAGNHLFRAIGDLAVFGRIGEGISLIGRSKKRTAQMQNAGDTFRRQQIGIDRSCQQAMGCLANTENLPAMAENRTFHHSSDDRIEAGTIAAAG